MLEDQKINVKVKLSALWGSLIAFFIYGDYFELYIPGKVEGLYSGTAVLNSPTALLVAAIFDNAASLDDCVERSVTVEAEPCF